MSAMNEKLPCEHTTTYSPPSLALTSEWIEAFETAGSSFKFFKMILRIVWLLHNDSLEIPDCPRTVGAGASRFLRPHPHGDGKDGSEIGGRHGLK